MLGQADYFAKEKGIFVNRSAKIKPAARRLYLNNGFKEIGVRKGYYEKGREDAVIMRFDGKVFLRRNYFDNRTYTCNSRLATSSPGPF